MADKTLRNVIYLESEDVNEDGSLKPHVVELCAGRPCLVMLQGNFCHFCTNVKPMFQALNDMHKNEVLCMTCQIDGVQTEQACGKKLMQFNQSGGVPAFLGYDTAGKFKTLFQGNRTKDNLVAFARSLK
jgi:hypothetical protein